MNLTNSDFFSWLPESADSWVTGLRSGDLTAAIKMAKLPIQVCSSSFLI
jgi:hypothetical protein